MKLMHQIVKLITAIIICFVMIIAYLLIIDDTDTANLLAGYALMLLFADSILYLILGRLD